MGMPDKTDDKFEKSVRGAEIAARITLRYADNVQAVEKSRKACYVPLSQKDQIFPVDRDVARTMKKDLDREQAKVSSGRVNGWDSLMCSDSFQKRMQFLHDHARVGHNVEEYGEEGRYEGEFLNGMRHGHGLHTFRGEMYDGDWKWDQRHGTGTLTLKDGSMIKGEWQDGKPHGYACMTDTKGNVTYEGEFKEGKRNGLGHQVYESGDMYNGGWRDGKLHDRGVYYFRNGDKLYGMWNMGKYDGVGVFHYAEGSISRRVYKDGILMSVQDYEHPTMTFGRTLNRGVMQRHTRDTAFPKEVFMLTLP